MPVSRVVALLARLTRRHWRHELVGLESNGLGQTTSVYQVHIEGCQSRMMLLCDSLVCHAVTLLAGDGQTAVMLQVNAKRPDTRALRALVQAIH